MKVCLKYDLFRIKTGDFIQKEVIRDLQDFLDRMPELTENCEFTLLSCRDVVTDKEYKIVEDVTYGGKSFTAIPV